MPMWKAIIKIYVRIYNSTSMYLHNGLSAKYLVKSKLYGSQTKRDEKKKKSLRK